MSLLTVCKSRSCNVTKSLPPQCYALSNTCSMKLFICYYDRVHLGSDSAMITLSGVECMKDDPSDVDVLYAKVALKDSSNR